MLTLALPKGRLMKQAAELFGKAGLDLGPVLEDSRRLRFELKEAGLVVLAVKPSDVPTYVEYGVADAGVAGRDILAEAGRDLYEMLDLGIGACRLAVAEPVDGVATEGGALRIATKYPECARRHFLARGRPVEIIKLHGSVELAVLCGLADRIVDLVETGETLKQNNLVETDTILEITARLVVNRASLKTRRQAVDDLLKKLKGVLT
jgi:ATP phosphoribosyltransferase